MTTTGIGPAVRDETAPTPLSRAAAAASLLLGVVIAGVLPAVTEAASYVGLLAAVSAATALVAGYVLWARASIMVRAVTALAAGVSLAGQLLQLLHSLPGAADLGSITSWEGLSVSLLAGAVVVCLLLDARQRLHEPSQDHPYVL